MSIISILVLFFGHWYADFVEQTDSMAIKKAKVFFGLVIMFCHICFGLVLFL
jgi:hypothetical protein